MYRLEKHTLVDTETLYASHATEEALFGLCFFFVDREMRAGYHKIMIIVANTFSLSELEKLASLQEHPSQLVSHRSLHSVHVTYNLCCRLQMSCSQG